MTNRETIEFLTLWLEDARTYVEDSMLVVEVRGKTFVVSLGMFREVSGGSVARMEDD